MNSFLSKLNVVIAFMAFTSVNLTGSKYLYSQTNPFEFLGKVHNRLLYGFNYNINESEAIDLVAKNLKNIGIELPDSAINILHHQASTVYDHEFKRSETYSKLSLTQTQISYLELIFEYEEAPVALCDYLAFLNAVLNMLQHDDRMSFAEKNIVYAVIAVAKHSALFWLNKQKNEEYIVESDDLFASAIHEPFIFKPHSLDEMFLYNPNVDTTKRQKRLAKRAQRQTQKWLARSARDTLWSTDSLKTPTHKWIKADAYGVLAGTLFGLGSWAALQYIFENSDNVNALSYSIGAAIFVVIPPINSAIFVLRYRKGKTREQRLNKYENWNVKP